MTKINNKQQSKVCPYCGKVFTNFDAPRSFDRMVTCGTPTCMGKRRAERLKSSRESIRKDPTSFASQ